MVLLINKSDVENHFQVAIGRSEKEFNKFIQQAQMFDLKPLMDEPFYNELLADPTNEEYKDLIDGSVFGDYRHEGLKAVLAYFTYGLYIFKGGIVDTSFGHVVKQSGQSDPVDYKERRDWYYEYRAQANVLWEGVKRFLNPNDCEIKTGYKTKLIK